MIVSAGRLVNAGRQHICQCGASAASCRDSLGFSRQSKANRNLRRPRQSRCMMCSSLFSYLCKPKTHRPSSAPHSRGTDGRGR